MSGLKILVSYHKPSTLLKNNIFVPIHLGRALANKISKDDIYDKFELEWLLSNMIGDDTGDNISYKNRELCELTGIYWAWKNLEKLNNPDYIGFMHYRRHLCFDLNCDEEVADTGLLNSEILNDEYLIKYGLTEQNIEELTNKYDIILGEKVDVTRMAKKSTYDFYKNISPNILHIEDYELVLDLVEKLYPEYSYSIREYSASPYAYFANIFILKKDLFQEYAQWLFSIIFEAEKLIDLTFYNVQEIRALAYISEWLFGIWYTHLIKTRNIKSLELKRTFINNTNYNVQLDPILPAFEKNNIAVVLSCDKNYVNYLGVTITSLFAHSSKNYNYDILVLHTDITDWQQKEVISISKESNHSIRFIRINNLLSKEILQKLFVIGHFSQAIYYRFFIPHLFKKFEKIVYLDTDLVLNHDVSELYNIELSPRYLLAAVRDIEVIRLTLTTDTREFWSNYLSNKLSIRKVDNYFNSGVIVFNIKQMNIENLIDAFFETLARIKSPVFPDQDILNIVCENRVKFLNPKWNVLYHISIYDKDWMKNLPFSIVNEYVESRKDPYIIHYAGCIKAWHEPTNELTKYFWLHARNTIFYERIIFDNNVKIIKNDITKIKRKYLGEVDKEVEVKELFNYRKTRAKYIYYKILSKICWGKKRKRYKEKRKKFKEEIGRVRRLMKKISC